MKNIFGILTLIINLDLTDNLENKNIRFRCLIRKISKPLSKISDFFNEKFHIFRQKNFLLKSLKMVQNLYIYIPVFFIFTFQKQKNSRNSVLALFMGLGWVVYSVKRLLTVEHKYYSQKKVYC